MLVKQLKIYKINGENFKSTKPNQKVEGMVEEKVWGMMEAAWDAFCR